MPFHVLCCAVAVVLEPGSATEPSSLRAMIQTFQTHAMTNDSTLKISVRIQFFRSHFHDSRKSARVGSNPPGDAAAVLTAREGDWGRRECRGGGARRR